MRRPYSPSDAAAWSPRARKHGAETACRREQVGRLALAAPLIGRHGDGHVVRLGALQHLALRQADRGLAEDVDSRRVARAHELSEGAGQKAVAGRHGDLDAELLDHRRPTPAQHSSVEDVVVHQRRHMDQLHRRGGAQHRLAQLGVPTGAQQREQRPHALAACGQRRQAGPPECPGIRVRRRLQALFHQLHGPAVAAALGRRPPGERRARGHPGASPTWRATAPKPRRR